ncbi:hypothetical protein XarbCFBP8149_16865 [Xanthomonas arboricola]|nr:hypothetical protein XarbCFBP8149_16865 [Xanthomonas arboricola]
MPKHLRPNRLSAFLSATDSNRWCLRGCRRGTLSGMDAAPEPTRTYLRRVPRWYACKRPRQTEAFAWNRQRFLHKIARSAELVGGAAPHPVSGHAGNPSLETRCKRPQQT